jgi:hypothetical protein
MAVFSNKATEKSLFKFITLASLIMQHWTSGARQDISSWKALPNARPWSRWMA